MSSRGTAGPDRGGRMSVEQAFALLPQVLDVLTSAPWWQLPDEGIAAAIEACHVAESRVAAAGIGALAEGVSRGLPGQAGARSGAAWLRSLVPVTPQLAGARATLAEALPTEDFAPTREALEAGAVAPGHASVVVRTIAALDRVPPARPGDGPAVDPQTRSEVQRLLLETATRVDPAQLGHAGVRIQHRLHPDAAEQLARDEDAQWDAREAFLVQERTGMWLLHGLLPPLAGATLRAALDPLSAPQPCSERGPDPRPARQRTADALTTLAELGLAARPGQPGALPRRGGSAHRVLVTGDLRALTADLGRRGAAAGVPPAVVETGQPGGWDLSPLTLQTLACDAELVPMLLDDQTGRPLDVGATRYPFPPAIRRAIELRDQHCTYPACTAPAAWCDAHHLVPFSKDGPTAEANGALLCGRHHRFVHANGWRGRIVNGHVAWRPPESDTEHGPNAHAAELEQQLRHLALRWLHRTRARSPDTN